MYTALFILLLTTSLAWDYPDTQWGNESAVCASGSAQSPIRLDQENITSGRGLSKLSCKYPRSTKGTAVNNGHTLQVNIIDQQAAYCTNLPRHPGDRYNLSQYHIHFGKSNGGGSEHVFRDSPADAEVHMVHYNAKYGGMAEAMKQDDGIVVISMLMKVGEEKDGGGNPVIEQLANLAGPGKPLHEFVPLELANVGEPLNVRLNQLLVFDLARYYTYEGSVTTPGCSENVTWVIAQDLQPISRSAIQKLRGVIGSHGKMAGNHRKVKPLNGRKVRQPGDGGGES